MTYDDMFTCFADIYKFKETKVAGVRGVTQPSEFHQALGGVGRNMAEALVRLGIRKTCLVSAVGNDLAGRMITDELRRMGLDTSTVKVVDNASTGS
jgi:pseudouridine kinase